MDVRVVKGGGIARGKSFMAKGGQSWGGQRKAEGSPGGEARFKGAEHTRTQVI